MIKIKTSIVFTALMIFVHIHPFTIMAQIAVPNLQQRVNDETKTLSTAQIDSLEKQLALFENKKGSQIAVLIVPTTKPESIEQFSIRVVEKWKLGRKNIDDGVLLLIAKNDRRLRIEVGYGLEGSIPDAKAKQIISEQITPHFKAGNFHSGILAGVTSIQSLIDGAQLPPPVKTASSQGGNGKAWFQTSGFVIIISIFIGSAMSWKVRGIFSTIIGVLYTLLMWFFVDFEFLLAVFIGGFVFFIILIGGFIFSLGRKNSGGYSAGSSGGSFSSGSSSFSSSSFSGGGGSFGGGGSSGSW